MSVCHGQIKNYFFNLLVNNFFGASKIDFQASRCWLILQLALWASCKINFLCTLVTAGLFLSSYYNIAIC